MSLKSLGVSFQKVVPDFDRLLTASGNNVEAAPWDNEAHRRTSGEVSHPDLLANPKRKQAILCSEERRLRTRNRGNIYHCSYFHLISGDANDLSCMLKAEEI